MLPDDLPVPLALAVMDVCGAPALTHRVVAGIAAGRARTTGTGVREATEPDEVRAAAGAGGPVVAVLGAAGKSGSLSAAAARRAGASRVIGVVPSEREAEVLHAVKASDAGARAGG